MERIILGLDDEQASQTALDWVVERSAVHPVSVDVLSVAQTARDARRLEATARAASERLRSAHSGTSARKTIVVDGSSIPEAVAAAAVAADLVVIAHHRHRRVRAALTGWLPLEIAAASPRPVVVVPDDWRRRYGRIVVGLAADGSSDNAVRFAAAEAIATGRTLDLVVIEPDYVSVGARMMVETAAEEVRSAHPGIVVRPLVWAGDRDDALADACTDASLVVVGSHGRSTIESVVVGAVLHRLMAAVTAPVCAVR